MGKKKVGEKVVEKPRLMSADAMRKFLAEMQKRGAEIEVIIEPVLVKDGKVVRVLKEEEVKEMQEGEAKGAKKKEENVMFG